MKKLSLWGDNRVALVDDEDHIKLNRFIWYLKPDLKIQGYVNGKMVFLTRFLLNVNDAKTEVDHKDRNRLNCQRKNLRKSTRSQNEVNKPKMSGMYSSIYKGVSFQSSRNKWFASIMVSGKRTFLGRFDNEIDAAKAYDSAAIKLHGDFACLNLQ